MTEGGKYSKMKEIRKANSAKEKTVMLKRFEVENFKGFQKRIVFDLTARDYGFNAQLVKDGIVNKALLYGKNGTGKSNLGIALFDIVLHLTDKEKFQPYYLQNYRNYESGAPYAEFKYYFQFGEDEIIYEYAKMDFDSLVYERVTVNQKPILYFHFFERKNNFISLDIPLNVELEENTLSVVKYIYRSVPQTSIPVISKMVQFADNMLWYRSLSEGNNYCGFRNGVGSLIGKLYESGKLKEFEAFLRDNGIDYHLGFETNNGKPELYVYFENGKAHFGTIASTGTMSLFLFFTWSVSAFDKISFLFIDEFDAFFHYESAEHIVKLLNGATKFQTVLTTHNTYLMQNKLTRPDCCYLLTNGKITNLYDATDREIREGHNLEKMYINGAFTE